MDLVVAVVRPLVNYAIVQTKREKWSLALSTPSVCSRRRGPEAKERSVIKEDPK